MNIVLKIGSKICFKKDFYLDKKDTYRKTLHSLITFKHILEANRMFSKKNVFWSKIANRCSDFNGGEL